MKIILSFCIKEIPYIMSYIFNKHTPESIILVLSIWLTFIPEICRGISVPFCTNIDFPTMYTRRKRLFKESYITFNKKAIWKWVKKKRIKAKMKIRIKSEKRPQCKMQKKCCLFGWRNYFSIYLIRNMSENIRNIFFIFGFQKYI